MPQLSVIVPVFNECDNILPLISEIGAALHGKINYELIYVDDHSEDGSCDLLLAQKASHPELRVLHHQTRSGQSAAVWHGVRAAQSSWIITLDGDGQNDPADMATLLAARAAAGDAIKLFIGWRTTRRDSYNKRVSSRVANAVRSRMLGDATPDTGCGLKLFERAVFLDLPYFDHMHRYLPALFKAIGWQSQSVPVGHRPRRTGVSKYGTLDRLWVGLADLCGVAWLMRRSRSTKVEEL